MNMYVTYTLLKLSWGLVGYYHVFACYPWCDITSLASLWSKERNCCEGAQSFLSTFNSATPTAEER